MGLLLIRECAIKFDGRLKIVWNPFRLVLDERAIGSHKLNLEIRNQKGRKSIF